MPKAEAHHYAKVLAEVAKDHDFDPLTAVAIISPIGGIGDRISPSGHECLVPADPALPRGVANGAEDVRRVVRLMIRAGADVIKCATTGGASSRAGHGPKDPAFDAEEMRALVEESHAQGRKVIATRSAVRGCRSSGPGSAIS